MTIEEAIKILTYWDEDIDAWNEADNDGAIQLGIEALKAVKLTRENPQLGNIILLAGESAD